jgi:hypothetical protein
VSEALAQEAADLEYEKLVSAATKALKEAPCICEKNPNDVVYMVDPFCPQCGTYEAQARIVVSALIEHVREAD